LSVCILSQEEAGRLEHWRIWPVCKAHRHCSRKIADAEAKAGDARYLDGPDGSPLSMIVPVGPSMWTPVGTSTLSGVKLQGMRVWGNASKR